MDPAADDVESIKILYQLEKVFSMARLYFSSALVTRITMEYRLSGLSVGWSGFSVTKSYLVTVCRIHLHI